MTMADRPPAELRSMFGANLRQLATQYPSISELSRQLGINRTQFNRYLSGESFPRPDVLARICAFFDVDARILLEPVDRLKGSGGLLGGDLLADFVGAGVRNVGEIHFPSGFYRFTRRSFLDETRFIAGLVYVFRDNGNTYIRGFEAREAMRQQGLPDQPAAREFRGFVMQQEDGVAAVISRRNATTGSFNYLSRVTSFENNYWVGYVARSVREAVTGARVTRMVYEHIGKFSGEVMAAARHAGFVDAANLLPYHRRLLQPDEPFR